MRHWRSGAVIFPERLMFAKMSALIGFRFPHYTKLSQVVGVPAELSFARQFGGK